MVNYNWDLSWTLLWTDLIKSMCHHGPYRMLYIWILLPIFLYDLEFWWESCTWLPQGLLLPFNWLGTFVVYAMNIPTTKPFVDISYVYSAILKWLSWKMTNVLCITSFYHTNNTLQSLILYRWEYIHNKKYFCYYYIIP